MASDQPREGENQRRIGVQVIARAAEICRELASVPDGLTTAELADRLGLARPTAYRIARALMDEDFLRQRPSGRFIIGPAFVVIAGSVQRGLRHHMRPFMERLCKEIDETIDLAMLESGEALFVDQYVSVHGLRIVAHMGARLPLHCTASGKALLAAVGPEKAAEVLRPPLTAYTRNTIVNVAQLRAELDRAAQTGVAYDHEEYLEGVCAVATPVRDATGGVAALTVEMPVARFAANEREIVAALERYRDLAQRTLLGSPQTMAAQAR